MRNHLSSLRILMLLLIVAGSSASAADPAAYNAVTDARLSAPEDHNWLAIPAHIRQLGLQPVAADHGRQRRAAKDRLDFFHRRGRGAPIATDRERWRYVHYNAAQSGYRNRCA